HRAQLGATVETYLSLCGDVLEVGGKLELHHRPVRGRNPSPHLPGIGFQAGGAQCSFEAGRVAGPGVHLKVVEVTGDSPAWPTTALPSAVILGRATGSG